MSQNVAALLRAHGLRPRKGLGQNFLTDPAALARIVEAADLSAADTVVEVGAGVGTLTRLLAERAGQVLAVELDPRLVDILRDQLADLDNVRLVQGDILQLSDLRVRHLGYKVVANLPYYITSAVLRRFLSRTPRPRCLVLTLQREVAQRIVAEPGQMSVLAVSVQLYGRPRLVARIPAGAFYPTPKVDSAIVRIDVGDSPTVALPEGVDEAEFFRLVRAGFSQKRKKLRNSLSAGLGRPTAEVEQALHQAGISPARRAQALSLEEWAKVARAILV